MGITGAVGNTAGFISPYLTGIIVDGQVGNDHQKEKHLTRNFIPQSVVN